MKISARSFERQIDHEVADANAANFKLDSDGNVICTVKGDAIDLTHGTKYTFFVSISPQELDALYRFSMTTPKPIEAVSQTGKITRRPK